MDDKINGSVIPRHGVEDAWFLEGDYIPKMGEKVVYDPDKRHNYFRIKIGDGKTKVVDLPFYSEMNIENRTFGTLELYARRPISYWNVVEKFENYQCEEIGTYGVGWPVENSVGVTHRKEGTYFPSEGQDRLFVTQLDGQRTHRQLLYLKKIEDAEQRFQFRSNTIIKQGPLVFSMDINFLRLPTAYVNRGISFDITHQLGEVVPNSSPWGMVFDLKNEAPGVYYLDIHGYRLYIVENFWYNIRLEYSEVTSEKPKIKLFINNELVYSCEGTSALVDARYKAISSVDVFVGGTYKTYHAFLGEILFDNIYLGEPIKETNFSSEENCTYPAVLRPESCGMDNIVLRKKDGTIFTKGSFTEEDHPTVVISKGYVDGLVLPLQQTVNELSNKVSGLASISYDDTNQTLSISTI